MTVLYIVIALLVGWFIGFLDSNLRTAKKIKAAEANAEIKIRDAEKKIALVAQPLPSLQEDPGILRLKRDNGRFVLELDGTPVAVPLSPDKKKRLIELITVFRPWLEGGQPAPVPPQPAIAAVQEPVSRPIQPVTLSPKKPDAEKNLTSLSIVQQIDAVLQARIMATPLAKQGIRLQESLQGGVEVYVGLQKFLTVDDVPDTFIKSEIRAAIAEWEEKYTPRI
jgi:hypothetical protein